MGPLGPVLFVSTVITAEMVPLLPTQPLSVASGLLFGGPKVAHIHCHLDYQSLTDALLKMH